MIFGLICMIGLLMMWYGVLVLWIVDVKIGVRIM